MPTIMLRIRFYLVGKPLSCESRLRTPWLPAETPSSVSNPSFNPLSTHSPHREALMAVPPGHGGLTHWRRFPLSES